MSSPAPPPMPPLLRVCSVLWIISSSLLLTPSLSLAESTQHCLTLSVNSSMTLQKAVDLSVSEGSRPVGDCVRIQLPSGEHKLTSQTLFPAEMGEIEFIGLAGSVYVECDYNTPISNYTWYFAGLHSVTLRGLQFDNCPRPLRLDTIAEVEIQHCSFRYFSEAALDIFNCHHTLMNSSELEHNTGSGIVNASYRGNTGGVSFGYNTLPENFSTPILRVSNCTFRNNSATATSAFLTSSQAFFDQVFTGRGGSMAVFSNESRHDLMVTISDCFYENNIARSFGGAAYLLLGGFGTHHKIFVERTTVVSNTGRIGGGGIQSSFFNVGPDDDPLLMTFVDCEFISNTGIAGGGLFVFTSTDGGLGNLVRIQNTLFSGNRGYTGGPNDYGAAVALSLLNPLVERSNFPRHEVTNCTFTNNTGANGIISVGYTPMSFTGTNNFTQNNGTALRVVGALVYLSGDLLFIDNSVGEESALHMLSFAQVVLSRGLYVSFEGNTGRFGASILIESITTSTVYTQLAANPQCPFLHEDVDAIPQDWTEVTVQFASNTAILGSALYMSSLNACSWYSHRPPFFNNTFLVTWPIWQIEPSNKDTGYTELEQENSTLSVQTQARKLVISKKSVRAWPGLRLTLIVSGWDEFSHTTTATAGFSFSPINDSLGIPVVRFIPEVVVVGPDPTTGLLTRNFTVYYGVGNLSTGGVTYTEGLLGSVSVQDPIDTLSVESASFTLEALICPAGYVLRPHATLTGISVCTCNEEIRDIVLCEDDQETVVIKRGRWAVFVPSSPQNNLALYPCPPGYCRCSHDSSVGSSTCVYSYSHSDPDMQCNCDRRGTLCGECREEGMGVSALLNECVTCSSASGLLILALIIVEAVVILVVVLLDTPLPSWIYPFIFYVQLAPIMALDFPDSFIKVGKYLYFLGSASSFYFVYDFCLYGEMGSEMAYFLRYLPLFVGGLTCTPIIFGRSWVYRKVLKKKPLKHHGVWLVVLLSYSHLVYTSMTILNCPSITDTNGQISSRWYVNGEVQCFSGGHVALGLLAILLLLTALLLIPLLVLVTTDKWRIYGLKYFRPPLAAVYREGWEWWASVELGRRFLLLLFTVSLPQNEVVRVFVIAVSATLYTYCQPYRSRLANFLETAVNLNFLFLLLINTTSFFHDDFFTFPSLTVSSADSGDCAASSLSGIAVVSWILMPLYYLPVLGACATAAVLLVLFVRAKYLKKKLLSKETGGDEEDSSGYMYAVNSGPQQSWTIQLPDHVGAASEGYLTFDRHGKSSKRGKPSNRTSFFNRSSIFSNPDTAL